jgi:putative transposase
MLLLLKLTLWVCRALALSRQALVLDNLALRHQLATLAHGGRRPRLVPADRLFWVALRRVRADWAAALAIVKPATVVAWHRRAYRAYWRRISRRPGRPRTDAQLRDLIRCMVTENRWGAPRIHGELLKLGFRVSERTVSRYIRTSRPRRPPGTSWKTFLDNHREVLAAMDFFTVPTITFQLLHVLLIIQHERRKVLHVNVTAHPTAAWVSQQLREAFPFEGAPRYLQMGFWRGTAIGEAQCRSGPCGLVFRVLGRVRHRVSGAEEIGRDTAVNLSTSAASWATALS